MPVLEEYDDDVLQNEIDFHYTEIARIKCLQNRRLSVMRIPPEVLSQIFGFCRPPFWGKSRESQFLSFLHVTHVCSSWRAAALADPHCWTLVPCMTMAETKATVERAGKLPLHFNCRMSVHSDDSLKVILHFLFGEAKPMLTRIRTLHCDFAPSTVSTEIVLKALRRPAPFLEELSLSMKPPLRSWIRLPSRLFKDSAPLLWSFHLHRCSVALDCPILAHLHSFKYSDGCSDMRVPLDTLLAALGDMYFLEDLELSRSFIEVDAGKMNQMEEVLLPRLKSFKLVENEIVTGWISRRVRAPIIGHLHIRFLGDGTKLEISTLLESHLVGDCVRHCKDIAQSATIGPAADASHLSLQVHTPHRLCLQLTHTGASLFESNAWFRFQQALVIRADARLPLERLDLDMCLDVTFEQADALWNLGCVRELRMTGPNKMRQWQKQAAFKITLALTG
jgi:hypothetical protein